MAIAFDAVRLGSGKNSPSGISMEGKVLFFVLLAGGAIGTAVTRRPGWLIAGALIGLYFLLSIRVADKNEAAGAADAARSRSPTFFADVVSR